MAYVGETPGYDKLTKQHLRTAIYLSLLSSHELSTIDKIMQMNPTKQNSIKRVSWQIQEQTNLTETLALINIHCWPRNLLV